MATAQHPNARTLRRGIVASALVVGLVGGMVLASATTRVEASSLFGGLRSAGEAAFIAGHRGDRSSAPENTMPAFNAAFDSSMDFIEADIQLTKDNVPVMMHDTFVNRTTNGQGRVRDFTYSEIHKLDAGAWYSPTFQGTHVPKLESLLSLLQAKTAEDNPKKALLELKGFWSLEEVWIVTDLIAKYRVGNVVIMSSFDPVTIDHIHEVDNTLPLAIITNNLPTDPVAYAKLYGAVALIVNQSAVENDPWVVDRMHRSGLGIILYTLNSKAAWERALRLGVDGIITDRPGHLDHWLSRSTAR
ncbi:MAG: glycerophosphodiester phosphodiesterase family protein [Terrimesophilobacter sp.]